MTVPRAGEFTTVRFLLEGVTFEISIARGQIVHQAFHQALPSKYTAGCRLTFHSPTGDEIFADNFVGQIEDHFGSTDIVTRSTPISGNPGPWRTIGFDHLAVSVADRPHAKNFFSTVVGMQVMRDDAHLTVLATGPTALFLFDAGSDEPLAPDRPSSWHHIGFVVDNLEHAYAHLRTHQDALTSDFALLDRDERWSLYFFYRNGEVTFMIQFSEIKAESRGITDTSRSDFPAYLYDYASRPYGIQSPDDE
ncbi:MAG: VOC family protein [Chloroflexia bacterium]|nr:VOC family protein [Chloroflexia bacterium]